MILLDGRTSRPWTWTVIPQLLALSQIHPRTADTSTNTSVWQDKSSTLRNKSGMSINSCNSTQLTLLTQLNETDITYRVSTYVAYPLGLMTSLLWCATSSLDDKILTSEQRIWLTELMEGFLTNSCDCFTHACSSISSWSSSCPLIFSDSLQFISGFYESLNRWSFSQRNILAVIPKFEINQADGLHLLVLSWLLNWLWRTDGRTTKCDRARILWSRSGICVDCILSNITIWIFPVSCMSGFIKSMVLFQSVEVLMSDIDPE